MNNFFDFLTMFDDLLWSYIALFLIILMGVYLTIKQDFFQLKVLFNPRKYIGELLKCAKKGENGIHPIKLYFASVGGMVGLGNLVWVVAVITMGGPGGLVWMWFASFIGMIVKYSEIYLGIKYRVKTKNGYDGGPMYYLSAAFKNSRMKLDKIMPVIVCVLLCIYGAEVSQFLIITDTFVETFGMSRYLTIGILLFLVMICAVGGVHRLSSICSVMMPPLMISYVLLGVWIISTNIDVLPAILHNIIVDAFTLKSSVGGFVGANIILAAHYGVARAVYSGDIGIGYDSIVQSETQTLYPERQARVAIFALFSDTLICTITVLIILITDVISIENLKQSEYVMYAISNYIPHAKIYMAVLFFIAGFTTIIGYLVVGQKCAKFLNNKFGSRIYITYAIFAFTVFAFHDQTKVMLIMSVSGGLLMLINISGIFILRKKIDFKL